jgi:hypothetical protein
MLLEKNELIFKNERQLLKVLLSLLDDRRCPYVQWREAEKVNLSFVVRPLVSSYENVVLCRISKFESLCSLNLYGYVDLKVSLLYSKPESARVP